MTAFRKVLVVDDDPVVGKSFCRVLSQDKGYVVITAHNAAEALERMREQDYDLVVTDIKMPGMDGVELAEEVRVRQPWTPVVIITGYGSMDNEQRAHAAGVSAFVRKPLSPEMIEEAAVYARQVPEAPVAHVVAHILPKALAVEVPVAREHRARNVALFFAAPFIGLAYALALPLVGVSMLAWQGGKALWQSPTVRGAARVVGLAFAPLLGLVYCLFLPVAGTLTLIWVGLHSAQTRDSQT
jgi:CheY-like chemotaxis protein